MTRMTVKQAMAFAENSPDGVDRPFLEDIAVTLAAEVRRLEKSIEDARERNPAVAMVDAADEGGSMHYYAEILPDRTVHVGDMLYAFPPLNVDPKHWKPSFYQWWEAHGQFLRAGGGQYEKTFAFHAFEAAAALYGAGNPSARANHLRAMRITATWPKWMRDLRLTKYRWRHHDD